MSEQDNSLNALSESSAFGSLLDDDSDSPIGQNVRRSFHGVMYQIIVYMLCIIRAAKKSFYSYQIYIEKEFCGNFDDIVIEYQTKKDEKIKVRHIQTKHKSNKDNKITTNVILSKSDQDKLAIHKYLESFVKIESDILSSDKKDIEDYIICTNNDFDDFDHILRGDGLDKSGRVRKLKRITGGKAVDNGDLYIEEIDLKDDLLYTKDCKCYRFVNDENPKLETFYKTNKTTINNFLKKLPKNTKTEKMKEIAQKLAMSVINPNDQKNRLTSSEIQRKYRSFLHSWVIIKTENIDSGEKFKGKLKPDFYHSTNKDIEQFKQILQQKLEKLSLQVDMKTFQFNIHKSFYKDVEVQKSENFPFENPYTEENVIKFIKKFKFVVNHPESEDLRKILKLILNNDMNKSDEYASIVGNALQAEICKELEKKRGSPYTKKKFETLSSNYSKMCKKTEATRENICNFFSSLHYQILVIMLVIFRAHPQKFCSYEFFLETKKVNNFKNIIKISLNEEIIGPERIIFLIVKHTQDGIMIQGKNHNAGDNLLKSFEFGIINHLPYFSQVLELHKIEEIDGFIFCTNIDFVNNHMETRNHSLPEKIRELKTTKYGNLYLEKVHDNFTATKGSEEYCFASEKNFPDYFKVTTATIEEFLISFSECDVLAQELANFHYKKFWPTPKRIFSFEKRPILKKYQTFILEKVMKSTGDGNERFLLQEFLTNEDKDVAMLRDRLKKHILDTSDEDDIDYTIIRFYIDEDFLPVSDDTISFSPDLYSLNEIMKFVEKIFYVVKHPALDDFKKLLNQEVKKVSNELNICNSSLVVSAFKDVLENELIMKEGSFNKKKFEIFLKKMSSTLSSLNIYGTTMYFTKKIEKLAERSTDWVPSIDEFMEREEKVLNFIITDQSKGCYLIKQTMATFDEKYGKGYSIFIKSSELNLIKEEIFKGLENEEVGLLVLVLEPECNVDVNEIIEKTNKKIVIISNQDISNISIPKIIKRFMELSKYENRNT